MRSISRWLLGWLSAVLLVSAVVAGLGIFQKAREEASELFDYELHTVALSLPSYVGTSSREDEGLPDFEGLSDDRLFIEIWDAPGHSSYRSLEGIELTRFPPGLRTIEQDGFEWRVFGMHKGKRFIQVAQPISVRDDLAMTLALRTVWPLVLFVPATLVIVLWVVRRGLRPLGDMSSALKARSFESLHPLALGNALPVELGPLVNALNGLLERLNTASRSQRVFIADAAHELRSPLAALKLQIQAAERDGSLSGDADTLARIEGRLNRVIHLVQQLLALAREDAERSPRFERFSLRRLGERIVSEYGVLAEAKGIDLGLECRQAHDDKDNYAVLGEVNGIGVLLGNLVDNAIRYTPPGGTVDVVLSRTAQGIDLRVIDVGPGIPVAEREWVFDRFYRVMGTQQHGSGLGLAIAARIAQRHDAPLRFEDNLTGQGLCAVLEGLRGA